ncbi:hypothetical protein T069G_03251 [Trichoderma breve]|uniref:Uncharacterized protein n=1 Tax=Trichoderma breve TaxID=2034170 RepID=A0A9W9E9Q5_9HYPO|nr:hypothetical protein T069G_03251 [Trichoderma breve]KAJ4862297.1 hypothetical protein T069G_03251 [Trichoderma breve]
MAHSGSAMTGYDGGGFVKAEETVERLDGRQMLFNNTGGDAIHVYLNINDVPISTPDPKDADTFCCTSSDSLDATFAMHAHATHSASILVKLFAPNLGFDDAYAGQIRISSKDIIELTAKKHDEDALNALRRFCPTA